MGNCRPVVAPAIFAQMGIVTEEPTYWNGVNVKAHFSLTSCVSWLVVSMVLLVLSMSEDQTPSGKCPSDH